MDDDLALHDTIMGKAVFTKRSYKKGEEIIEFTGDVIRYDNLPECYDHYFQIDKHYYMGPSGTYDDFINHSCNPNAGLFFERDRIILKAIKQIKEGEELFWDYSTTMDEDNWEMDCLCGSKHCRGRIRDFKYLPGQIQAKYLTLGIVPYYLVPEKEVEYASMTYPEFAFFNNSDLSFATLSKNNRYLFLSYQICFSLLPVYYRK